MKAAIAIICAGLVFAPQVGHAEVASAIAAKSVPARVDANAIAARSAPVSVNVNTIAATSAPVSVKANAIAATSQPASVDANASAPASSGEANSNAPVVESPENADVSDASPADTSAASTPIDTTPSAPVRVNASPNSTFNVEVRQSNLPQSSVARDSMIPGLQKDLRLLKGQVSTFGGRSPLLYGTVQNIPEKTKVELVVPPGINMNSEISQKGDEIQLRIAKDIMDGDKVLIPGGWYVRGLVTEVAPRRRGGRNGYVSVQFDKLVSPDGEHEVDFNANLSTKDNKLTSVLKVVGKDAGYVGAGSFAGALLAVQFSGIAGTVAMQGYNVAGGAAIGGAIGLFAALKRYGKISSTYEGDTLKLTTAEAIALPGFDKTMLPSAQPIPHLEGLEMKVKDYRFAVPPWGDRSARLLSVEVEVLNNTKKDFNFFDVCVTNDHAQTYNPTPFGGIKNQKVVSGKSGVGKVVFTVGSPKRKYALIFFNRRTGKELSRVAIN